MDGVEVSDRIDALMEAATIADDGERLAKIRTLVTGDFVFVNPGLTAKGPEALSDAFGFLDSAVTVVRTSELDYRPRSLPLHVGAL